MRFRPCIDIHNGKVKQIVGGSLAESAGESVASENYVSAQDAAWFAALYKEKGLAGGHIILLNKAGTPEYEADLLQAESALAAWPGGLMIGGGVTADNASEFLALGASHVIVTSYLFEKGVFVIDRLRELAGKTGPGHLVIDLSCRKRDGTYYVVTDRWQTFTELAVTEELLQELSCYCDEFLVHGVDQEGLGQGMEEELVKILARYVRGGGRKVTYAGGIGSLADLAAFKEMSDGLLDVTIGSALKIFGGEITLEEIAEMCG